MCSGACEKQCEQDVALGSGEMMGLGNAQYIEQT